MRLLLRSVKREGSMAGVWLGSMVCDFCQKSVVGKKFVDGRTTSGPWAVMCIECSREHGVGLGTGSGQLYGPDRKKIAG
jgi:hypothetical protein